MNRKAVPSPAMLYLALALLSASPLWGGVFLPGSWGELWPRAAVLALAAVGEELLFRGLLLHLLAPLGQRAALWLSALAFGAAHGLNLLRGADVALTLCQMAYAAAFGLLFAAVVLRRGTLLPAILAHAAINLLSLLGNSQPTLAATAALTVLLCGLTGLLTAGFLRLPPREG